MTDPHDDLEDLLTPRPGQSSPHLRESLHRATQRALGRERWMRRAARVAAVAAVFLVGVLAGWLIRPERERVIEVAAEAVAIPIIVPVPIPEFRSTDSSGPRVAAGQVELQAEMADDRAEAARLYRQAGDAFLRDQDYANATRCYRLHLNRGGDNALSLATDDSWLLISLKNAAFKEKIHVAKIDG